MLVNRGSTFNLAKSRLLPFTRISPTKEKEPLHIHDFFNKQLVYKQLYSILKKN